MSETEQHLHSSESPPAADTIANLPDLTTHATRVSFSVRVSREALSWTPRNSGSPANGRLVELAKGCSELKLEHRFGLQWQIHVPLSTKVGPARVTKQLTHQSELFGSVLEAINTCHITAIWISVTGEESPMRVATSALKVLLLPGLQALSIKHHCESSAVWFPKDVEALAAYLFSASARGIATLVLNCSTGEMLRRLSRRAFAAGLARHNTTLTSLGISTCYPDFTEVCYLEDGGSTTASRQLAAVFRRNMTLSRRVRHAALRLLVRARVLLNARPGKRNPSSAAFPFLKLPPELRDRVLYYCSGDEIALSAAQVTRVCNYSQDRQSLVVLARTMARMHPCMRESALHEWLSNGGMWWEGPPP